MTDLEKLQKYCEYINNLIELGSSVYFRQMLMDYSYVSRKVTHVEVSDTTIFDRTALLITSLNSFGETVTNTMDSTVTFQIESRFLDA